MTGDRPSARKDAVIAMHLLREALGQHVDSEQVNVQTYGIRVMVILDTSAAMRLAGHLDGMDR